VVKDKVKRKEGEDLERRKAKDNKKQHTVQD
jgi:hypothetical protein